MEVKVSHIVTVQTEVRDRQAVERACTRLGLALPEVGEAKVYATTKKWLLVRLPDCELRTNLGSRNGSRNRVINRRGEVHVFDAIDAAWSNDESTM